MPIVKTNQIRPGDQNATVVGGALILDPTAPMVVDTPPLAVSDSVDSIIHVPRVEVAQALQYVEGTNWSVDYYSQVVTADSEVMGLQTGSASVAQQYTLIRNLELKLQGSMSATQDQQTKTMNYTGTAIIYAGVIPNQGDCFIANMENGSAYLFKVTTTEKKQVFKEAVFEINFEVQSDQEALLEIINSKVARTHHFMKEYLAFGKNPVLQDNQYQSSINAQKAWRQMLDEYMNMFFSDDKQTLVVPGKNVIYDPYVVRFVKEQFDTHHHANLAKLRPLNIQESLTRNEDGLYAAITKRDSSILSSGFTVTALKSTKLFAKNPRLATVYHLNLQWVTAAVDYKRRVDATAFDPTVSFDEAGLSIAQALWQDSYTPYTKDVGFNPVCLVPTYVFNTEFYKQRRAGMTSFERVVYDYINKVNSGTDGIRYIIAAVNELRHQWSDIDTYYMLPILIVITRDIAYNPSAYSEFNDAKDIITQGTMLMDNGLGTLTADEVLAQWANLDSVNVYDYFTSILNDKLSL